MNLLFLGGAESIGASCALLEVDGRRWIIDCGVRMKGKGDGRLPDLARIETLGPPSAILVTHAHLDHIGALPVLHQRFPLTPIFATPPTIDLTRVQLFDSLRIMEEEAVDGELPLYSAAAVESLLGKMLPVTPYRPFRPDGDGPEVTFFPAGHILGACALGIVSSEGRLFFSGDVSVDNQRTIPGMRAPRFHADVAVFESTYGNRLHARRAEEERRLVETVVSVVRDGGKVLIPAFAIGRAQEVILILLRAQLLEEVSRFPIWVDGMVRRTCGVYAANPWYLQSTLRRRVEKHGDPFFGLLDTVRPVKAREERARILEGEPCAIVSSSGMLSGGPSPLYARALAADRKNFIAVTGYQDEESPGRRLLEAASGRRETIPLDGAEVAVKCRVGTYALSGHASGSQIAALAHSVRAADVFLVHGESTARRELADLFLRERLGRVHLPHHGTPFAVAGSRRTSGDEDLRRLKVVGVLSEPGAEALGDGALASMAQHLRETYREGTAFTVDELHRIALGTAPADDATRAKLEASIRASIHFAPHPHHLFHFSAAELGTSEGLSSTDNPAPLLARLDEVVPAEARLLRKSYQPGSRHMTLVFAFPDVSGPRYREAIEEVFRGSGWTYEVHPLANPRELERAIREEVSPTRLARNPSLRIDERVVVLHVSRGVAAREAEAWEEKVRRLEARTGFRVELKEHAGTSPAKEARDAGGRLEINLAYAAIREAFASERHAPYKVGRKPGGPGEDPFIEIAFISPEVGKRYAKKLEEIGREIGWRLEESRVVNMHAVLETTRNILAGVRFRKGPSFQAAERRVRVVLEPPAPEREVWEKLRADVLEATGYELEAGP